MTFEQEELVRKYEESLSDLEKFTTLEDIENMNFSMRSADFMSLIIGSYHPSLWKNEYDEKMMVTFEGANEAAQRILREGNIPEGWNTDQFIGTVEAISSRYKKLEMGGLDVLAENRVKYAELENAEY